jgi:hypothetical protein
MLRRPVPEMLRSPVPEMLRRPVPEMLRSPVPEMLRRPVPEMLRSPVPEMLRTPVPEIEFATEPLTSAWALTAANTAAENATSPTQLLLSLVRKRFPLVVILWFRGSITRRSVVEREFFVKELVDPYPRNQLLFWQSFCSSFWAYPAFLHRQPVVKRLEKLLALLSEINAKELVLFIRQANIGNNLSLESQAACCSPVVEIDCVSESSDNLAQ